MITNISSDENIGIILLDDTGQRYTRQTGGIYIDMPEANGTFFEFERMIGNEHLQKLDETKSKLINLFGFRSKYLGRSDKIDEETALCIDFILKELQKAFFQGKGLKIPFDATSMTLKVDREHLNKSQEAWIYITVQTEEHPLRKAILTWPNSD